MKRITVSILALLVGCSEDPRPLLLDVKPDQEYTQEAVKFRLLEVHTRVELDNLCQSDVLVHCCMGGLDDLRIITYLDKYKDECLSHELQHQVMGPLHVGEG